MLGEDEKKERERERERARAKERERERLETYVRLIRSIVVHLLPCCEYWLLARENCGVETRVRLLR